MSIERKNSRPLYVMDDDYIEQKYVKAEEERQKRQEEERLIREREEAVALAEAERQRKAAEAERRRRKEEDEHLQRIEAAKKQREDEDKRRKQQEAGFQSQLNDIEGELSDLEQQKSKFLSEKLNLENDLRLEESDIRQPLAEIERQRKELAVKEQELIVRLKAFEKRGQTERTMLAQKETAAVNRIKELTSKRRDVQTEMLKFLQQPIETPAVRTTVQKPTTYSLAPPSATQSTTTNTPTYHAFSAGSDPASKYQPSVEIVGVPKPETSGINEQIALLDEFLATGVLSRTEYEDAKKKAYEDYTKTSTTAASNTSAVVSPPRNQIQGTGVNSGWGGNNPSLYRGYSEPVLPTSTSFSASGNTAQSQVQQTSVAAQVAQLEEYFRMGVLSNSEFEDAKTKVYTDAGLNNKAGGANSPPPVGGTNQTFQNAVKPVAIVTVLVPSGMSPGQTMTINYQGRYFNVVIPQNVRAGQPFTVSVPSS